MNKALPLVAILLFSILQIAFAADTSVISPQGDSAISVMSPSEEAAIEERIAQIEASTGIEIGVAIVDSTEGKPISQLAFELGNQYGIGKKEVFNGVLILIAVNDREWFIATAKGIEGTLSEASLA